MRLALLGVVTSQARQNAARVFGEKREDADVYGEFFVFFDDEPSMIKIMK